MFLPKKSHLQVIIEWYPTWSSNFLSRPFQHYAKAGVDALSFRDYGMTLYEDLRDAPKIAKEYDLPLMLNVCSMFRSIPKGFYEPFAQAGFQASTWTSRTEKSQNLSEIIENNMSVLGILDHSLSTKHLESIDYLMVEKHLYDDSLKTLANKIKDNSLISWSKPLILSLNSITDIDYASLKRSNVEAIYIQNNLALSIKDLPALVDQIHSA